jgi:hypothetical protein
MKIRKSSNPKTSRKALSILPYQNLLEAINKHNFLQNADACATDQFYLIKEVS